MEERVFLNGRFLSFKEARVSVLEPGFLYGWGVFESMRSYRQKIVYFNEHLQRIKNSCKVIGIKFPYSLPKLKKIIEKTVEINAFADSYVRLTLWKSKSATGVLVAVKRYRPYSLEKYKKGFSACIFPYRQNEDSFLVGIKTTSYLFYRLADEEARRRGFDEALILNKRGYLSEASRSNIFLLKNNELFTPSLECGCLNGITRRVIFDLAKKDNLKIYEGNFTLQDLAASDEAFLTNSLIGVMPLVAIEKRIIARGICGRRTADLIKKYRVLMKNGN